MKKHTASIIACLLIPLAGLCAGERVEYGRLVIPRNVLAKTVEIPERVTFQVLSIVGKSGHAGTEIILNGEGYDHELWEFQGKKMSPALHKNVVNQGVGKPVLGPFTLRFYTSESSYSAILTYKLTYPTTEDSSSSDATEAEVEVPADVEGHLLSNWLIVVTNISI